MSGKDAVKVRFADRPVETHIRESYPGVLSDKIDLGAVFGSQQVALVNLSNMTTIWTTQTPSQGSWNMQELILSAKCADPSKTDLSMEMLKFKSKSVTIGATSKREQTWEGQIRPQDWTFFSF
ncbi:hypothetical protein GQ602_007226 [Ophiocordyceps camponoti-floridani]|uniref:Uncharacterized protein n=1 Tax=Ophiocordyceps camponoti-floridani TaxID=2030778 RepID=A0A8H4VAT5_9HYPO|nr:hypothetical protein GQ602_007226 [Ophiocordyceps camponoti-floridani]